MIVEAVSSGSQCIMYILAFVVFSQAGLFVFDRLRSRQENSSGNEATGMIFGAISLIYSLILAFVIVAVWTDYENLNVTIEKEADKLNNILAHSSNLPDTLKEPISSSLSAYCTLVVTREWTLKQNEYLSHPSAIPSLRMMLLRTEPADKLQEGILSVIDDDLSNVSELRRERLDHIRSQVPGIVWLILKAGTVMLIVFSYFLDVPSARLKRTYLFFLSSFIAMSLFLVEVLDDPFNGSAAVSKKPYENIIYQLKQEWFQNEKNQP